MLANLDIDEDSCSKISEKNQYVWKTAQKFAAPYLD